MEEISGEKYSMTEEQNVQFLTSERIVKIRDTKTERQNYIYF